MQSWHYILIALLGGVAASAIVMPWLLGMCHKLKLTETVGTNRKFSIPRVGGMALAPSAAVGLLLAILLRDHISPAGDTLQLSSLLVAAGASMIYLVGIIDDIFSLNRWLRRIFLFVGFMVFPFCGLYLNNLYGFCGIQSIDPLTGYVITVVAAFTIARGYESMKDSDGMAGGLAMLPLGTYCLLFGLRGYDAYAMLAAATMGALLVYLYYNLYGDERLGTKTYMGHAGSYFLIFSITYLALKYAMDNRNVIEHHADGLLLSYSLFLIPFFECIRVSAIGIWEDMNRQERRQMYIHHRLLSKGFTQKQTLMLVMTANVVIVVLNVTLHHLGLGLTWIVLADVALYALSLYATSHYQHVAEPETNDLPNQVGEYNGREGLVSIIMPTWNSSRYVAESIESIMAQTYRNWELLITDDCSTDNTMEIVEKYAKDDKRIRVLHNQKNSGPGVSRNRSILAARGRYIAFCDSDDRWMPKKLELQLQFMRQQAIALCFCPYYTCDENDQYLGYISAPQRVTLFEMMCDNKIGFLTCIYDTRLLGKNLMPEQRKRQDHAMLLNLLRRCQHAYSLSEPLAFYRIHAGNISAHKVSLLKYNAHTYTAVFGWNKVGSYAFLFTFFLPCYFYKRTKNLLINIYRAV